MPAREAAVTIITSLCLAFGGVTSHRLMRFSEATVAHDGAGTPWMCDNP